MFSRNITALKVSLSWLNVIGLHEKKDQCMHIFSFDNAINMVWSQEQPQVVKFVSDESSFKLACPNKIIVHLTTFKTFH